MSILNKTWKVLTIQFKNDGEYDYEYSENSDGEYEYEYEYGENSDGEYEYEYKSVLVLVLVPNLDCNPPCQEIMWSP